MNVPAMPAAAPHPTRVRRRSADTRNTCPMVDPKAEPICTMGPSRPTEPPVPIVIAEARALIRTRRVRITPPRKATASITSGTPWPLASLASRYTRGPTRSPPMAGMKIRMYQGMARTASRSNAHVP